MPSAEVADRVKGRPETAAIRFSARARGV